MKAFNLKEYLDNPSRKVITRDGQNVKIHCTNFIGSQNIIGQIEGYAFSTSFSEDGRYANDRDDSHLDLFFAPEKREGWVNVYRDFDGLMCGSVFATEEDAKCNAKTAIATVKIDWEE